MIGFFQNSMAKHHRLIFGVLLVFIVVSFVFYTGSGSVADLMGLRRSAVVMGVNVSNRDETAPYRAGVLLANGGRLYSAQDLIQRIYMVKTAEAFRIPEPTQDQLSEYLSEQGFSAEVIANIERNFDISEDVLRTSIIHSWKVQRFLQTFGNVPAVFDADVEIAWKEMNTQWKIEVLDISRDQMHLAFGGHPKATPETDKAYYDEHKEDFRVPEKVKLAFAKIVPAADLSAIPEPTEFELSSFVAETLGNDAEKAAEELSKNRAKYVADWKKAQALYAAAAEFSNTLYEKLPTDAVNPALPNFEEEIKKSGIAFADIPAFPRNDLPKNTGIPAAVLESAASGLNETLWRTDAIPAEGAVYVVIYRGSDASFIPPFEDAAVQRGIAQAMSEKWVEEQMLGQAQRAKNLWQEALDAGKTPTSVETAIPQVVAKIRTLDAFSVMSVPEEFANSDLVGMLKNLPEGAISPMIRKDKKSFAFVRVISKTVPALDKNGEEFKRVWQYFDNQTSWETFQMQLMEGMSEIAAQYGLDQNEE